MMYEEETTDLEPMIYDDEELVGFEPAAASRWQFIWFCSLILSFCYELPIARPEPPWANKLARKCFDASRGRKPGVKHCSKSCTA